MRGGAKKNRRIQWCYNFFSKNHRGQIWIETVIYTLIALTMIGAVLAFVIPRIEEIQDKSVIEQSADVMKDINNIVLSLVQGGPGNKRLVEAKIKKGALIIDTMNNKIIFEMETDYLYSEPCESEPCDNKIVNVGNIKVLTKKVGGINKVTLTTDYPYDITYNNVNTEEKRLEQSPTAYKILIENKGGAETIIDFALS